MNAHDWRHVPTYINIAEILSREALLRELIREVRWIPGPEFLLFKPIGWSITIKLLSPDDPCIELKKSLVHCMASTVFPALTPTEQFLNHYNLWHRLSRGIAILWKCLLA